MELLTENEIRACEGVSLRLNHRVSRGEVLTVADLAGELDRTLKFLEELHLSTEERTRLLRFLETRYIVSQGAGSGGGELMDSRIPEWVPAAKPAASWPFWYRYERLLRSRLSPSALQELDSYTDRVLGKLGNPKVLPEGHPESWDVRGMVAGHVQSGKTSNYIGLICKAADAGYKLIVVLTGIHENLRVQTQERVDEGFIGKSARGNPRDPQHEPIGVGRINVPGCPAPPIAFWGTTQMPGGDFRTGSMTSFGVELRPDLPPVVLVVKKHASVLRRLVKWAVGAMEPDLPGKTGKYEDRLHDVPHFYRKGSPLLVIDDEADQASVDTVAGNIDDLGAANPDHDPTSINRLIRSLLRCFDRSGYVGYTATPFANILIHDGGFAKTHGDDLFPRDFIVNLPTPPSYVGPMAIFGRRAEEAGQGPLVDGLESVLVEEVRDHARNPDDIRETQGWMPPVHQQGHGIEGDLPASLRQAITDWTLAGGGMVCRGRDSEHHSMLIHVTRFQMVMDRLTERVNDYWDEWSQRVMNGDPTAMEELQGRWESSHPPAREAVLAARPHEATLLPDVSWSDLVAPDGSGRSALQRAVEGVRVLQVHGGTNGKPLEYRRGQQLKVIAVGGNKLSRGLTLENLTVSYFLRTTRMYDTLMQMGRWFGYRQGLLDLCRLYMPRDLRNWFEHMTDATEELREEFERMAAQGATPRAFGLRVRSHPVMTVTSSVKMRHGTRIQVSFSDSRPETVVFATERGAIERNWKRLKDTVEVLGAPAETHPRRARPDGRNATYRGFLWNGVGVARVAEFLKGLVTPEVATIAHGPRVAQYIERLAGRGELTEWTVFLRHNPDWESPDALPHGIRVGRSRRGRNPVERRPGLRGRLQGDTFATKILIDPEYESVDMDPGEYQRAIEERSRATGKPADHPLGYVRLSRPPQRGLLLIYCVQPYDGGYTSPAPGAEDVTIQLEPDTPLVGFAVSFPSSDSGERVEYIVGNVYLTEEIGRMRECEDREAMDA